MSPATRDNCATKTYTGPGGKNVNFLDIDSF
jgi:hypothetical protein